MRERVEAHQQGRPERHHDRHRRQRGLRQLGVRRRAHAGLEPETLERHVGDVEPAGPPGLVLPVDVVHVLVGVLVDARARLVEQLRAVPELQGTGGAHLRARGHLAFRLTRGAEGALPHIRLCLLVLKLRDVERAGDHAVTAAEAAIARVGDRAGRALLEGAGRTRRHAGGLDAVHALRLGEPHGHGLWLRRGLWEPVDHREGVLIGAARAREHDIVACVDRFTERVCFGAGRLAGAAADAARRVDEHAAGVGAGDGNCGRRGPRCRHQRGGACGVDLEERAATELHDRFLTAPRRDGAP